MWPKRREERRTHSWVQRGSQPLPVYHLLKLRKPGGSGSILRKRGEKKEGGGTQVSFPRPFKKVDGSNRKRAKEENWKSGEGTSVGFS